MGYKVTVRQMKNLFCVTQHRKRTLPDIGKLMGTKESKDYLHTVTN